MRAGPPPSQRSVRGGCRPSLRQEVQEDLLVAFGTGKCGGSLGAHVIAVDGAPLAQPSKRCLDRFRIADDPTFSDLASRDLELWLEQRHHFRIRRRMSESRQNLLQAD